jgi:hypothetical protein
MKKIIEFKRKILIGIDRQKRRVYIDIEYENKRFSISGYARRSVNSDIAYGGQIQNHLTKENIKTWKISRKILSKILAIWKIYHLNDLHAGCEHQRLLGWELFKGDLFNDHIGIPCPICGYKFGSAWKRINVPQNILRYLNDF